MPRHLSDASRSDALSLTFAVYFDFDLPDGVVDLDMFSRFITERRGDLKRIARHTRGEHSDDDVVNEAWLMAETLSERFGLAIDYLDVQFQELLLSHLYQQLVRYAERNVRHAIRLDHGADAHEVSHPLAKRLSGDESREPLSVMLSSEEHSASTSHPNLHHSLASAYLTLLRHCDNRMRRVARHLLISLSYAYRCCANARQTTTRQHALELAPPAAISALRPWRHQRLERIPQQLEFDFEPRLFADPLSTGVGG